MHKRAFFLFSCSLLLLGACRKAPEVPKAPPAAVDTRPVKRGPEFHGEYGAYRDGIIGNGMLSVIFFHAAGDPESKNYDALLTNWFLTGDFPVSVYRVDFDDAGGLLDRYSVEHAHTFVKIDGSGNPFEWVKEPTEKSVRELLTL